MFSKLWKVDVFFQIYAQDFASDPKFVCASQANDRFGFNTPFYLLLPSTFGKSGWLRRAGVG